MRANDNVHTAFAQQSQHLFLFRLRTKTAEHFNPHRVFEHALPGALAGILWMLFVTGTTLSVPSLMGSIMCIGVATANSILMVTFANDERVAVPIAREAMLSAGYARIRPVLMTASAMILGMLPMALSLGEGGEQNAPLGRAVIGGLVGATITTLFIVPIIYSYLRTNPPVNQERRLEEEERDAALEAELQFTA